MDATDSNNKGLSKKRSNSSLHDSDQSLEEGENPNMSRAERKKLREKKRRNDVNKGFDELLSLLIEIEPDIQTDPEERIIQGLPRRAIGRHEDNVLSRVDLLNEAIKILRRVHGENEMRKQMLKDILASGRGGGSPFLSGSFMQQLRGLGGYGQLFPSGFNNGFSGGAAAAAPGLGYPHTPSHLTPQHRANAPGTANFQHAARLLALSKVSAREGLHGSNRTALDDWTHTMKLQKNREVTQALYSVLQKEEGRCSKASKKDPNGSMAGTKGESSGEEKTSSSTTQEV